MITQYAQKLIGIFMIWSTTSIAGYGILYCGTITETVTFTDSSLYAVGEVFVGSYQYESPTINGDFGTFWYNLDNPSSTPTLYGSIFGFGAPYQNSWLQIRGGNYTSYTHLEVSDGAVTDFHKEGQHDGFDYGFGLSGFTMNTYSDFTRTQGTMAFSHPCPVPEGLANSGGLLSLGFIGLVFFCRRFSWR